MKEFKYIVMCDENDKKEIFIFPKTVNHDCMAQQLVMIKNHTWGDWERVHRIPVSAGFTDGKTCYGESETLRLKSSPEDTKLLNN